MQLRSNCSFYWVWAPLESINPNHACKLWKIWFQTYAVSLFPTSYTERPKNVYLSNPMFCLNLNATLVFVYKAFSELEYLNIIFLYISPLHTSRIWCSDIQITTIGEFKEVHFFTPCNEVYTQLNVPDYISCTPR